MKQIRPRLSAFAAATNTEYMCTFPCLLETLWKESSVGKVRCSDDEKERGKESYRGKIKQEIVKKVALKNSSRDDEASGRLCRSVFFRQVFWIVNESETNL